MMQLEHLYKGATVAPVIEILTALSGLGFDIHKGYC